MRSFVQVVFMLFLLSFHQVNATRYLPSIIWDHLNPMLSCKCNWFHPITEIEIYDRFEFVCPTARINCLLLAKFSRPEDLMNLNVFQRKWKGGIDENGMNELKKQMMNGEFCDPTHNDTEKILTCKMGKAGQGKTIRFAGDKGFYRDDVVVFFNNQEDGREDSLKSTVKNCAMALVTKATWEVAKYYDFTYGKNLDNTLTSQCKDVNTTCKKGAPSPTMATTSQPTNSSTTTKSDGNTSGNNNCGNHTGGKNTSGNHTGGNNTNGNHTSGNNTNDNNTNGNHTSDNNTNDNNTNDNNTNGNNNCGHKGTTKPPLSKLERKGPVDEDWDRFKYGFLAGFGSLLFLIVVAALVYCLFCRTQKRNNRKTNCQYRSGDQCPSTTINGLGAQPLPKKTPLTNGHGINNIAYKSETLRRDSDR